MKRILMTIVTSGVIAAACMMGGCEKKQSGEITESAEAESSLSVTPEEEAQEIVDVEASSEIEGEIEDTTPILEGDFTLEQCIRLGQYEGLKLKKTAAKVTDEEARNYAESIQEAVEVTDKNAKVRKGDTVTVAFNTFIDGQEIQQLSSDGYDLRVGDQTFVVEGFEDGLIGLKKGESTELDLTMPSDYEDAALAGKSVRFVPTIITIKRVKEPAEEDIASAKEFLQKNSDMNSLNQLRLDAWSAVETGSEIIYLPASYVDEAKAVFDEISAADAENYGTDLNGYLEILGLTQEEFDHRKDQYARHATKSRLLLEALEKALGVTKDDPDYEKELQEYCEYIGISKEELLKQNGESSVRDYIQTQRICDILIERADVTNG